MIKKRGFMIVAILLIAPFVLMAQKGKKAGKGILANAQLQYEARNYQYAIPYYIKYLNEYNTADMDAIVKLADCYRMVSAYGPAIVWYSRAYAVDKNNERVVYAYAASLACIKAYEQAIDVLEKLIVQHPEVALYKTKLQGYKNRDLYWKDSLNWKTRYLSFNTPLDEYCPAIRDKQLLFISNRPKGTMMDMQFGWSALPFYRVYYIKDTAALKEVMPVTGYRRTFTELETNELYTLQTSLDNDRILRGMSTFYADIRDSSAVLFDMGKNSKFNLGPMSFSKDGSTFFYTRNKLKKYKNLFGLEIAEAVMEKHEWKVKQLFPGSHTAFSFFHPAINEAGNRLFFSSDMPGGYGGNDLYYIDITAKERSAPTNLGPVINTPGNEAFPFIKGDTLFFSSDGHAGLGGLDIYRSVHTDTGWSIPWNMGYPVNTSFDDFGITWYQNGREGYFSSNRFGSDDVFALEKKRLAGPVLRPLQGKPAQDTVFVRTDIPQKQALLPAYKVEPGLARHFYDTIYGLRNKFPKKEDLLKKDTMEWNKPAQAGMFVKPAGTGAVRADVVIMANVYFRKGNTHLLYRFLGLLDSLAGLMQTDTSLYALVASFTDCLGKNRVNSALSRSRSRVVKAYLVYKGVKAAKIKTEHFGSKYLVKPCNPQKYDMRRQAVNRRSEIFLLKDGKKKWMDIYAKRKILEIDTIRYSKQHPR